MNARKLEHGLRLISTGIPYTSLQALGDNDVPTFWLLLKRTLHYSLHGLGVYCLIKPRLYYEGILFQIISEPYIPLSTQLCIPGRSLQQLHRPDQLALGNSRRPRPIGYRVI